MTVNKKGFRFLIGILCLTSMHLLGAQQWGHVNLLNLMEDLPEAVSADSSALVFAEAQWKAFDEEQQALQQKYEALVSSRSSLSPVDYQGRMNQLDLERTKLQERQSVIQQEIYDKRKELFEPIFEKVSKAIEATGKQQGLSLILDQGKGAILYNEDSQDVGELVREQLRK